MLDRIRGAMTKLALLPGFLSRAFDDWLSLIWESDLDACYCCDGRECGCGGQTTREVWGGKG